MLLSPESRAGAMEHYQPDFRFKCFTQSCLGGLLPLSLRIIQMPECPLLFLCSQPQGDVMLKLGLGLGLVRRSSVEILSLHDVTPGYLQWAPQSFQGVQCFLDPGNLFHKVQLVVCHNQMTLGAVALLSTNTQKMLKYPDPQTKPQTAADTQLWRCQPRWCFFSSSSTPCCVCWYNHN